MRTRQIGKHLLALILVLSMLVTGLPLQVLNGNLQGGFPGGMALAEGQEEAFPAAAAGETEEKDSGTLKESGSNTEPDKEAGEEEQEQGENVVVYHEVTFALPKDTEEADKENTVLPETMMLPHGTLLSTITTPTCMNKVFLGWCYDEELTKRVGVEDAVEKDLTLYPQFADGESLKDYEPNYVSELEVSPQMEITVVAYGLTQVEVEQRLAVRDLTEGGEGVEFTLEEVMPEEETAVWEALELSEEVLKDAQAAAKRKKDEEITGEELKEELERLELEEETIRSILTFYAPEVLPEEEEPEENQTENPEGTGEQAEGNEAEGQKDPSEENEDAETEEPEEEEPEEESEEKKVIKGEEEETSFTEEEQALLNEIDQQFQEARKNEELTVEKLTEADVLKALGLPEDESLERYLIEEMGLSLQAVEYFEDLIGMWDEEEEEEMVESGRFIIRPVKGQWEPGDIHQIEILDTEKLRFLYQEEVTHESVIYYNFQVYREEVFNMTVNESVQYFSADSVQGLVPGGGLLSLAVDPDEDSFLLQNPRSGQFTYTGEGEIEPGTVLAVYGEEGTESAGKIGYYKVTENLGDGLYAYETPDFEDVVFLPDNIPVANDGSFEDGQVILTPGQLDFSDPFYADFRLDENTTLDVGDFLTFYNGNLRDEETLSSVGTGIVTAVEKTEFGSFVVSYEEATTEDMDTAMEMYLRQKDIEIPITDLDQAAITEELIRQAESEGMAEKAQQALLAALTCKEEDLTSLDFADALQKMTFATEDGGEMSLAEVRRTASGGNVQASDIIINAQLSPTLSHFAGDKGLRAEFSISFTITINLDKNQETQDQNVLVIKASMVFEQEIIFSLDVAAKLKWGWVFIFYLSKECNVDITLTVGTYTGAGFICTVGTEHRAFNGDAEWDALVEDVNFYLHPDDAKNLITFGENLKQLTQFRDRLGQGVGAHVDMAGVNEVDTTTPTSQESGLDGGLPEKYQKMLSSGEYVPLVKQQLFELSLRPDPLQLIELSLTGTFVVSYKITAMLGFGVTFAVKKSLNYHIKLFQAKASKTTADLEPANFNMDFYAMGMMGIRAGIELDARVGLISTKLDSVGFKVGLGLYAEVYGFFYAYFKASADKENNLDYGVMGSLLFELGMYFTINFYAQVFADTFSASPSIVDAKLPFLTWGDREAAIRFTPLGEIMTLEIPKGQAAVHVPDEIYGIDMMALDSGEVTSRNMDTRGRGKENQTLESGTVKFTQYNEKNYTVEIHDLTSENGKPTNNCSFQYLPDSNEVYVLPANDKVKELWAEVTLTYSNNSFGFNTASMRRKFKVHWEGQANDAEIRYFIQQDDGEYLLRERQPITGIERTAFALVLDNDTLYNRFPGYQLIDMELPASDKVESHLEEIQKKQLQKFDEQMKAATTEEEKQAVRDLEILWLTDEFLTEALEKHNDSVEKVKNHEVGTFTFYCDADYPIVYFYFGKPKYKLTWKLVDKDGDRVTSESAKVRYGDPVLDPNVMTEKIVERLKEKKFYNVEWTWDIYEEVEEDGEITTEKKNVAVKADDLVPGYETTLTGKLVPQQFNVILRDEFEEYKNEMMDYDAEFELPKVEQEGYTHIGWKIDGEDEVLKRTADVTVPGHNLLVIAQWDVNQHTVEWKVDGKTVKKDTLNYGDPLIPPVLPHEEGQALTAWEYDGDLWAVGSPMPDQDLVLEATWTEAEVSTVQWMNDEDVIWETEVTYGSPIRSPGLVRRGFTLEYWQVFDADSFDLDEYKEAEANADMVHNKSYLGPLTDSYTMPNQDIILYPKWRAREYTVTWVLDGQAISQETVLYGNSVLAYTPARQGYTLSPWMVDGRKLTDAYTMPDRNITLTAEWIPNKYMVTWELIPDGEIIRRNMVVFGGSLPFPAVPTMKGYTFTNWTTAGGEPTNYFTMPDREVTVVANWSPNVHQVTWQSNGATVRTDRVAFDEKLTEPVLDPREGYDLLGWKIGDDYLMPFYTMPDENITVIADWAPKSYTLTWMEGEETLMTEGVAAGKTVTNPGIVKKGYTLTSWTVDGQNVTDSFTMPAKDTVAQTTWTLNKHTVTWEILGVTVKTDTVEYGSSLTAPILSRVHFTQGFWYVNGEELTDAYRMPDRDITVQGYWFADSYALRYLAMDGTTVLETKNVLYGAPLPEGPEAPAVEGRTFTQWLLNGNPVPDGYTMPAQAVDLLAGYDANTYKVTWYADKKAQADGIVLREDAAVSYNDALPTAPDAGVMEGYSFANWLIDGAEIPADFTMPAQDVVVVGSWTIHEHMIRWYADEAAFTNQQALREDTVSYNGPMPVAPTPEEREGYVFDTWLMNSAEIPADFTMPDQDVAIVGQWKRIPKLGSETETEDGKPAFEIRTLTSLAAEKEAQTLADLTPDDLSLWAYVITGEGEAEVRTDVEATLTWAQNAGSRTIADLKEGDTVTVHIAPAEGSPYAEGDAELTFIDNIGATLTMSSDDEKVGITEQEEEKEPRYTVIAPVALLLKSDKEALKDVDLASALSLIVKNVEDEIAEGTFAWADAASVQDVKTADAAAKQPEEGYLITFTPKDSHYLPFQADLLLEAQTDTWMRKVPDSGLGDNQVRGFGTGGTVITLWLEYIAARYDWEYMKDIDPEMLDLEWFAANESSYQEHMNTAPAAAGTAVFAGMLEKAESFVSTNNTFTGDSTIAEVLEYLGSVTADKRVIA